jgi:hypothetical protein
MVKKIKKTSAFTKLSKKTYTKPADQIEKTGVIVCFSS